MSEVSVLIVEDEPIIAADLENQLQKAGITVLDTLDEGESVLSFLENALPDLIIMDVQIYGDLDGVDLANHINQLYSIPIIFLTSNTDSKTFNRAKLSYPHAFLSKPFRINDVLHAIELAVEPVNTSEGVIDTNHEFLKDRIFIRVKDAMIKVLYDDILYFEADGSYSKIVTSENKYVVSLTLKKIETIIELKNIVRTHRSYLTNIQKIDRITDGYLHLDGEKIPLSRSNKEDLLRKINML